MASWCWGLQGLVIVTTAAVVPPGKAKGRDLWRDPVLDNPVRTGVVPWTLTLPFSPRSFVPDLIPFVRSDRNGADSLLPFPGGPILCVPGQR